MLRSLTIVIATVNTSCTNEQTILPSFILLHWVVLDIFPATFFFCRRRARAPTCRQWILSQQRWRQRRSRHGTSYVNKKRRPERWRKRLFWKLFNPETFFKLATCRYLGNKDLKVYICPKLKKFRPLFWNKILRNEFMHLLVQFLSVEHTAILINKRISIKLTNLGLSLFLVSTLFQMFNRHILLLCYMLCYRDPI